ncbi:MAG: hypothetical protein M3N06_08400, partial [Pseudomonadota bacterium]|nr:hypothetical protein [Pseudomonadota bacterium]
LGDCRIGRVGTGKPGKQLRRAGLVADRFCSPRLDIAAQQVVAGRRNGGRGQRSSAAPKERKRENKATCSGNSGLRRLLAPPS